MAQEPLTYKGWQLVIPWVQFECLHGHLFPGDGDEHGAAILAGIAQSLRGTRLLARELHLARDGVDYVAGRRGYRRLKGEFITPLIQRARDQRLVYLAVHNHGGTDRVAFSSDDLSSHERGYPALLDVAQGMPVGALVFARNAIAGDIWINKSRRLHIREAVVLGGRRYRLYPCPPQLDGCGDMIYDRQERIFGETGQALLASAKIGIIGLGGAGSQLATLLVKLGVCYFVLCDGDRLEPSNVPRVDGATRWLAMAYFQDQAWPNWVRGLARRLAVKKVRLAAQTIKRANLDAVVEEIDGDFYDSDAARKFIDCDYIFLAADTQRARLLFNAIVHQYLIPGVQVGAKIRTDKESGQLLDLYSVVRPVMPDHGCLWCNGLISPSKLQDEFASDLQREAQNYGLRGRVIAPSVNTLNATATGTAANDFMTWWTGLTGNTPTTHYARFTPLDRTARWEDPRKNADCTECGKADDSRFARGDALRLPLPD